MRQYCYHDFDSIYNEIVWFMSLRMGTSNIGKSVIIFEMQCIIQFIRIYQLRNSYLFSLVGTQSMKTCTQSIDSTYQS